MDGVRMLSAGEQGLVVEFGEAIDFAVNAKVHRTAGLLQAAKVAGVLEVIPTYRSLLVYFDPLTLSRAELVALLETLLSGEEKASAGGREAKLVEIPVCYGGEFGPDLEFVAKHNGLSTAEVIAIHTSTPYLVYMLGFTPGFPYLGGMSERIATPRLQQPRTKIPAGSVGIAGSQTGFYPIESPGGWQLIGRTPVQAFMPEAAKPFLFDAGNYLQFVAVSQEEYESILQEVAAGRYQPKTSILKEGEVAP